MVMAFHIVAFFGIRRLGAIDLEAVGFSGFLFFFVHTSFVLMLSLERQQSKLGRGKLFLVFMARRCFRIYPLSILLILVIALFKLPLAGHPWEMHWPGANDRDIVANILLIQNLTGSPGLQGPLWSLPVEMQMYPLLPLLFLLARRVRTVWTLLAGWALATTVIFVRVQSGHGYLTSYLPCFLAGVISYHLVRSRQPRWPFWGWPLLLWSSNILFAVFHSLYAGWLMCLVVGLGIPQFQVMRNTWLRSATHFLAKYSYGFYLCHYLCIWLAFTKLRFLPTDGQWMVFFVTVIGLPILLYHLIEDRWIKAGKQLIEPQGRVEGRGLAMTKPRMADSV